MSLKNANHPWRTGPIREARLKEARAKAAARRSNKWHKENKDELSRSYARGNARKYYRIKQGIPLNAPIRAQHKSLMSLDTIIPPEITVGSELGLLLEALASREDIKTIIETGASSGEGSTACLAAGMSRNPSKPTLHSIEMSQARYQQLALRYKERQDIRCLFGCSTHWDEFLTPHQVSDFYLNQKTNLNQYPLSDVLRWLEQDRLATATYIMPWNLIRWVLDTEKVDLSHCMAVLDSSAFNGLAETHAVKGAKIIVLDDCVDVKHYYSAMELATDSRYRILHQNPTLRNGYVIFERKA